MEYYVAIKKHELARVWLMSILCCFVNESRKGGGPYVCVHLTKSLQDCTVSFVGIKVNIAAAGGRLAESQQPREQMLSGDGRREMPWGQGESRNSSVFGASEEWEQSPQG